MKNWIKRIFCKHDEEIYPITKKGKLGGYSSVSDTDVCIEQKKEFANEWSKRYCSLDEIRDMKLNQILQKEK